MFRDSQRPINTGFNAHMGTYIQDDRNPVAGREAPVSRIKSTLVQELEHPDTGQA